MPRANPTPQPKWFVLQVLNFVVIGIFVSSITYVAMEYRHNAPADGFNARTLFTPNFYPIIALWTVCLAYFFGFFGISFVDKETLAPAAEPTETPSEYEHKLQRETFTQVSKAINKNLQPLNDTPICAELNLPGNKNTHAAVVAPKAKPVEVPITTKHAEGDPKFTDMTDDELLDAMTSGVLKDYQLEKKLGDYTRAVGVRRTYYEFLMSKDLANIPYLHYDYNKVFGANCEIVIGYVPIPVGLVGPLVMNNEALYIPMATTEGCLVASTNRGCKAISVSGGCHATVLKDGITRAPCLRFPSAMRAAALKRWVETTENYELLEAAFNSTTNYGKLQSINPTVAGRNVYLRFCCMSGDAMGMNMVSKGCLKAIEVLEGVFPDAELVAISGNMCTDKKPAAINWILGRGKSIVVEALIPETVVTTVLKSSVPAMIETNKQKNHIGSAMAGAIGGFNAHAANIVTAVFLATGQDPAQNVESSNCITILEYGEDGKSLHVSVTMPSVEVGTVGGGTHLPAQANCLDICGVRGAAKAVGSTPGDNARKLAQIVGSSVLAGELSLIAALAANHLVRSHMEHNRKPTAAETAAGHTATPAPAPMRKNASMPNIASMKQ